MDSGVVEKVPRSFISHSLPRLVPCHRCGLSDLGLFQHFLNGFFEDRQFVGNDVPHCV